MTKKINSPEFNDIMTFSLPRRLIYFVISMSIAIFSLVFMLFFYNKTVALNFEFSNIIVIDSQRNIFKGIVNSKNVNYFPEKYDVLLIRGDMTIPAIIEESYLNFEQSITLKIKLCFNHEYDICIGEKTGYSIRITQKTPLYKYILGNISNDGLLEVWNSDTALKLSRMTQGGFPKESLCCSYNELTDCRSVRQICWKETITYFGKDKWHYPDVNCPKLLIEN